ncbi:hypothetical protein C8Q74DRAFT_1258420 [Fomes fomentarius]|nr:hypothetical protein C8Q74DRAFT_1258420 [Fomes fomentarius]
MNQKISTITWEKFVKLMHDLGFAYAPSTTASSVRFRPAKTSGPRECVSGAQNREVDTKTSMQCVAQSISFHKRRLSYIVSCDRV